MARYMVYLKKAKVSDVVHPKLLNIYVIPARIMTPLSDLSRRFQKDFPPATPALETILAAVSSSPQAFFHFVPSYDHYELYHQILIWLLKNDALIMLHVRFRLIATPKIKEAVYKASKERRRPLSQPEERGRKRKPSGLLGNGPRQTSTENGLQVELPAQKENRQPSPDQAKEIIEEGYVEQDIEIPEVFNESFINDPGKASRLEQLWIEEIARQRPDWERRFLQ
jgi:nitrogen permease regulator 3-like protein